MKTVEHQTDGRSRLVTSDLEQGMFITQAE